jgi:hypothetical protein
MVGALVAVSLTAGTLGASPTWATAPALGDLAIIAGTGTSGPPTAGPALNSKLNTPVRVAVDGSGNVYIADTYNNRIDKVTPTGVLSIIAGTGSGGQPTPGPATSSKLNSPFGLAVDGSGNVYIADSGNNRIDKVTPAGVLSIIAGTGNGGQPTPGPATSSDLSFPSGVAVDGSGNVYIADTYNSQIDKVTPAGVLSIIAGTGNWASPTPGPATSSDLGGPYGVAVDGSGNVYIADSGNNRIDKVTPAGVLSIIAGTGNGGQPTPGPATSSDLGNPYGVTVDALGNVYIADSGNNKIDKVTPDGDLSVVAGTGNSGAPTAGPATASNLWFPTGVAVDSLGGLYIADPINHRIEEVGTAVAAAPGAPGTPTVVAAQAQASVTWTAPASDGGSAITSYTAQAYDGGVSVPGATCSISSPFSSPLTCDVTGLTNGTAYTFKVNATNTIGTSTYSTASSPVTPAATAPGAPTGVSATAGQAQATVTWTAPGTDGGSAITSYTAQAYDGGIATGLTCTISSPRALRRDRADQRNRLHIQSQRHQHHRHQHLLNRIQPGHPSSNRTRSPNRSHRDRRTSPSHRHLDRAGH